MKKFLLGLGLAMIFATTARAEWKEVNCSEVDIKVGYHNVGTGTCAQNETQQGGAVWQYQNFYLWEADQELEVDAYYARANHNGMFSETSLEEDAKSSRYAKNYDLTMGQKGSAEGFRYLHFSGTSASRSPLQCITFTRSGMKDPQFGSSKRMTFGYVCQLGDKPLETALIEDVLKSIDTPN